MAPLTDPQQTKAAPGAGELLSDAAAQYLNNLSAVGKTKSTIRMYTDAITDFQKVCSDTGVLTIEQLKDAATGRKSLLGYLKWLRDPKNVKKRKYGSQETTFANRMRWLSPFLKQYGIKLSKDRYAKPDDPGLLLRNELPKVPKRTPKKYSSDILRSLLAAAKIDVDEEDLIHFFLATGFRDEEAAFCEWSDFDFRACSINVHDKPHWGWTPKDKDERPFDIPLERDFIERMKARRERQKGLRTQLVFPGVESERPNMHLIKILKRAAKRAQIDERVTLHQFRRTFGTLMAKRYGIETARKLLGHSDVKTTAGYLVSDEQDIKAVRRDAAKNAIVTGYLSEIGD